MSCSDSDCFVSVKNKYWRQSAASVKISSQRGDTWSAFDLGEPIKRYDTTIKTGGNRAREKTI